jgi:LysM repeat protein
MKIIFIFLFIFSNAILFAQNKIERGLGELIVSNGEVSENMLALHRDYPIGTMIIVKNTANGRTIKAKVIGTIPNLAQNKNVIVKISEFAYNALLAKGKKFPVETYKAPEKSEDEKEQEEKENEREREKEKEENKDKKIHVVKKGENLYSIAKKYKLKVEEIQSWNKLGEKQNLKVGQKLIISEPKTNKKEK